MKFPMTNSRRKARWMMAVALLAVAACHGGTEGDQGIIPGDPTDTPPPPIGAATVTTDQAVIPADGTTLVTARATLTDARGIARVGAPILFAADLADITWVTVDPDAEDSLYPTSCLAYTGTDGTAECVFRSGFTPGKTFINALGPASLGLGAATEVELTFAETFANVKLAVLECPTKLTSGDLPAKRQIAVRASRTNQVGEDAAIEDVRIYYTTTVGIWDRTLQNHTSDATDNTGVSDQFLRVDPDDDGKTVNIVMTAPGATPVLCTFAVGEFQTESQFTLTAQPGSVRPDGTDQTIALGVLVTDTSGGLGTAAPKVDHHIKFSTPVGTITPNPVTVRAGGTGAAAASLFLSGAVTRALQVGTTFTVNAVDDVSRLEQVVDIEVATEEVTVTVDSLDVTFVPPGPINYFADRIQAHVTTPEGSVAGRTVTFNFGDGTANKTALTDATGTATVSHMYTSVSDGDSFIITATDLLSNVSGSASITFAEEGA